MNFEEYEKTTGEIYGTLFDNYNDDLFLESVELFFNRHRKWGIDLGWLEGKTCLDAGCGGGRYLVALAKLKAKEIHGIDISGHAVQVADSRVKRLGFDGIKVQKSSVMDLPFEDNYFDYVVSSGVIHHTPDPYKSFLELSRVIKPGGKIFLSVYGKGGLKWAINDFFRFTVCKIVPFKVLDRIFSFFGVPANKRYNILDNLYVPYCYRYKEKEIFSWLFENGFINLKRVKFERYDYEKLMSRIIHGEGWIQVYADKKNY